MTTVTANFDNIYQKLSFKKSLIDQTVGKKAEYVCNYNWTGGRGVVGFQILF